MNEITMRGRLTWVHPQQRSTRLSHVAGAETKVTDRSEIGFLPDDAEDALALTMPREALQALLAEVGDGWMLREFELVFRAAKEKP